MQVWNITACTRRWVVQTQETRIRRVAWSPDGSWLVGGGYGGFLCVWNANDGMQQQRLVGHEEVIMSVAWSPDGKWLASGGRGSEGTTLRVEDGEWRMHSKN